MNRKPDITSLLLFTALLFGIIVRFYPVLASGFPLNDGGMFYSMSRDLRANSFALPEFATYNQSGIPFAYPPFGFYVAALLSTLTPDSGLWVFLYVPALINSLAIFAFYLFAKELLNSRPVASAVTLFFALLPSYFQWQVMGGGITRAFGFIFWLLMLWQALLLFKDLQIKYLLLAVLFGAGAVLSHPQTALQAAVSGVFIFLFYGRSKRGLIYAALFGLGVAALTAPWWMTVFTRHGMTPFLSAGASSPRILEGYLDVFSFNSLGNFLTLPLMILATIGFSDKRQPKRDKIFLVVWAVVMWLIDPRGSGGMIVFVALLMSGWGVVKLSAWIHRLGNAQAGAVLSSRAGFGLLFGISLVLLFGAVISDFQLVNTSLKKADLEMIQWVRNNIAEGNTFALATGREYSMSDPMQEWFPALTGQHSLTTMQGLEWVLEDGFFPYYDQLIAFQKCADVTCLNKWTARIGGYDYLVVLIPDETAMDVISVSLRSLGDSVRESKSFELVFESAHTLIFENKK